MRIKHPCPSRGPARSKHVIGVCNTFHFSCYTHAPRHLFATSAVALASTLDMGTKALDLLRSRPQHRHRWSRKHQGRLRQTNRRGFLHLHQPRLRAQTVTTSIWTTIIIIVRITITVRLCRVGSRTHARGQAQVTTLWSILVALVYPVIGIPCAAKGITAWYTGTGRYMEFPNLECMVECASTSKHRNQASITSVPFRTRPIILSTTTCGCRARVKGLNCGSGGRKILMSVCTDGSRRIRTMEHVVSQTIWKQSTSTAIASSSLTLSRTKHFGYAYLDEASSMKSIVSSWWSVRVCTV